MSNNILDNDIPKSANLTEESTSEERLIQFAIKTFAIVLTTVMLSMVGCSIHSNTYEADVLAEKVKMKEQSVKAVEAEARVEIEKIQAMERMIQTGANPIAIRCMDEGWKNDNTCMAVGIAIGKTSLTSLDIDE